MLQQMSCKNVYYAWRTYSELYPSKYLCIIHDKMDQKNTCIPRVNPIPKSLNQVMPLPISLTRLVVMDRMLMDILHWDCGQVIPISQLGLYQNVSKI